MDIEDSEFVVILEDEDMAGMAGSSRRHAVAGGLALLDGVDSTMTMNGAFGADSANGPMRASLMTRPRVMAWEHGRLVMRAPRPDHTARARSARR